MVALDFVLGLVKTEIEGFARGDSESLDFLFLLLSRFDYPVIRLSSLGEDTDTQKRQN